MNRDREDKTIHNRARRPILRYLGTALLGLTVVSLVLYAVAGSIVLPGLAKRYLEDYVAHNLQRRLSIKAIHFNPFALDAELLGIELKEADGAPVFTLQRLSADLSVSALLRQRIRIEEIELQSPWLGLDIGPDGEVNLGRLVNDALRSLPKAGDEASDSQPLPLSIGRVELTSGILKITDRSGATVAGTYISPINFLLRDISLEPGARGLFTFSAITENGGELAWEGDLGVQPPASQGRISLRGNKPILFWNFLRDELNIDEPHGLIDVDLRYQLALDAEGLKFIADPIEIAVNGLLVRRQGATEPLLVMERIALSGGSFDLDGNQLQIGEVAIADGLLRVIRHQTLFDWQHIMTRAVSSSGPADPAAEKGRNPLPWRVGLARLDLERVELLFEDRDLIQPLSSRIGELGLTLNADASQDEGGVLRVEMGDIGVAISDLSLTQAGATEALLRIDRVGLGQGSVDLATQSIRFENLQLSGGGTTVTRSQEGRLNWVDVMATRSDVAAEDDGSAEGNAPWQLEIATLLLDDFAVGVTDHGSGKPVALVLDPVSLRVTGASSNLEKPIDIAMSLVVDRGGKLTASGRVEPGRAAADLLLEVDGLSLTPGQPYLEPLANLSLDSGRLSTRGKLVFASEDGTALSYAGRLGIEDLAITEKGAGGILAGWRSLEAESLAFNLSSGGLDIDEIRLSGPEGRFVINRDLSTNWQEIVGSETGGEAGPARERGVSQPFPVNIGRVKIEEGKLDFSDLSLPLEFNARIHELSGVVAGISTQQGARASSDLKGRVDEFGSAEISGELNLFDPLVFTDMNVSFANLEMERLTPYTVKFAGHAIESGKLSLDLGYRIADQQLQGDNKILIDSLVLGEKVESPDAIDAPLELAIALLQDTEGRIDLGLPVTGDMDDPQFSYGHLVWKAIGNLLTKIVTAPFRALGAALGVKGENLDAVFFEPGQFALAPPEQEKLRSVAGILAKRPRLRLELKGGYDNRLDAKALKSRMVRLELAANMGRKRKPGEDPDPISLTDEPTRRAIEALYAARYSAAELKRLKTPGKDKAKKGSGTPEVSAQLYQQLFERLVSAQSLEKNALTGLAAKRAQAIADELTGPGKLPPARIGLGDPVASEGGAKDRVVTRLDLGVIK